jgi:hypothetical protein
VRATATRVTTQPIPDRPDPWSKNRQKISREARRGDFPKIDDRTAGKPRFDVIATNEATRASEQRNRLASPPDSWHYAGKDVKLDTPDRPLFWFKPKKASKYQVLYADLSVKEASPEEVLEFPPPESGPKPQGAKSEQSR